MACTSGIYFTPRVPIQGHKASEGFGSATRWASKNHSLRTPSRAARFRFVCRFSAVDLPKVDLPKVLKPQEALKRLGQEPKPGLGQNFLLDQQVVIDTVKAADINPGDHVIEVGPGTGVLTRGLLEAGARVTAIEKDHTLAAALAEQYKDHPQLTVVCDDFMRWRKKEPRLSEESETVKVVANLPYNITTNILKRLLPMGDHITEVVLMVQLEAAERLVSATAGDGDYRPISVRVRFYSDPAFVRKVDKSLYYPAPAVDGAIVRFKLKRTDQLPQVDPLEFFQLVGAAFGSKRKMLRNNLASCGFNATAVQEALQQIDLPPTARPSDLTTEKFVHLYSRLVSDKNPQ